MTIRNKIYELIRPSTSKILITILIGFVFSIGSIFITDSYYQIFNIPTDSQFVAIGLPPYYYVSITDEIVRRSPKEGIKLVNLLINSIYWYLGSILALNLKRGWKNE